MIDISYLMKRNYIKKSEMPIRPCTLIDCQEKEKKVNNELEWIKVSDKELKNRFRTWFE